MDLLRLLHIVRKRWRLLALCLLVSVGAAAYETSRQPKLYATTVKLLFSNPTARSTTGTPFNNDYLYQQRILTYVHLVSDSEVVGAALAKAGGGGPDTKVSVAAIPQTVLLQVAVSDTDPARAKRVADAFGEVVPEAVDRVETPRSGGASPVTVRLLEPAQFPYVPYSPRTKLNIALGIIFGLILAAAAMVISELVDVSVKDGEELSQLSGGAPFLGSVPYDERGHPLIALHEPRSIRAEAYRQVRTNLQFASIDSDLKTVVLTSALPGEGKTTLATNLGIIVAGGGGRVLIVDADLRRPMVASTLGLEGAAGLTTVILGLLPLDAVVQHWGDGLLDVLPSGPIPPNPSEILGSKRMVELIEEMASRYDLVIFDTPPALPVTDASVLALHTDGAVIVCRIGKTSRENARRVSNSLRNVGVNVLGTVANCVPPAKGSGYRYGYGYGYASSETATPARIGRVETLEPAPRRRSSGEPPAPKPAAAKPAEPVAAPAAPVAPATTSVPVRDWQFEAERASDVAIEALRGSMSTSRWRRVSAPKATPEPGTTPWPPRS